MKCAHCKLPLQTHLGDFQIIKGKYYHSKDTDCISALLKHSIELSKKVKLLEREIERHGY